MEKVFWLAGLLIFTAVVKAADSSFIITGKLNEIKSGTIELNIYENEVIKTSAKILHGTFTFNGFIQSPSPAVLHIKNGKDDDYMIFYVEPGSISISGKGYPLKDLAVNSPLNNDDKIFKQRMEAVTKWEATNAKAYDRTSHSKNESMLDSLDEVDFKVLKEKRKIVTSFVKDYPRSIRSAIAIKENYSYYAEADDVTPLYNLLDEDLKNTTTGNDIKGLIEVYKRVATGSIAPDITQPDPSGMPVSLSSLRGKYVLIDFWASWCGPCRRENPNVVNAYRLYKDKGFEIFGISYDEKKEKWERAIKDDKLTWIHVSELKGWKNSTSGSYGIKAIPSNLLLDKDGRIIARNIFGKQLSGKLAEIIK